MKKNRIFSKFMFAVVVMLVMVFEILTYNVTNNFVSSTTTPGKLGINEVNKTNYLLSVKGELFYNANGNLSTFNKVE